MLTDCLIMLALMLFASLPVGCAGSSSRATGAATTAGAPTATSGAPATAASSGVLVEFHRSGGFAGVDDALVINADRRASLTQKRGQTQFEVDQATFDQLKQQLDQAKLGELKEDKPAPVSADEFTYIVTYQGRTVKAQDTSMPESLRPVIGTLSGIVQANGQQ